jgi:ribose/xylose/arabinose/galactoside ABC-type transport system permease subunit
MRPNITASEAGQLGRIARRSTLQWSTVATLLGLYAALIVMLSILSPFFLSLNNFLNILLSVAIIGIISIGMTMLLVSGGLDLSVGGVVALVGVVIAGLAERIGIGGAVGAALLVGALIGMINGFAVTAIGINPLITTLATLSLARGLAFVFSGGLTQVVLDEGFRFWGRARMLGVPVPVIIYLALFAVGYVVLRYTTFGRAIYAIGGNAQASRLASVRVTRIQRIVYLLSGLGAALGGIVLTSQLAAGAPQAATGIELSVIAAVILGGTSLAGGSGSMIGTLLGVLIMGTLNNGLTLLSVNAYYQEIVRGLVLLLAVALDQIRKRE